MYQHLTLIESVCILTSPTATCTRKEAPRLRYDIGSERTNLIAWANVDFYLGNSKVSCILKPQASGPTPVGVSAQ
jgi:hypothetical protein